jgi:hypothetical protein
MRRSLSVPLLLQMTVRPDDYRKVYIEGGRQAARERRNDGLPLRKLARPAPRRCGKSCYDHAFFVVGIEKPRGSVSSAPGPILAVSGASCGHHRPERILTGMAQ